MRAGGDEERMKERQKGEKEERGERESEGRRRERREKERRSILFIDLHTLFLIDSRL